MIDNILPEHVELPHVLDLAVHLPTCMGRGGHLKTFRYLATSNSRSIEHVELPLVLDLAVHLVQLTTWMGRGGHNETFSLLALFP